MIKKPTKKGFSGQKALKRHGSKVKEELHGGEMATSVQMEESEQASAGLQSDGFLDFNTLGQDNVMTNITTTVNMDMNSLEPVMKPTIIGDTQTKKKVNFSTLDQSDDVTLETGNKEGVKEDIVVNSIAALSSVQNDKKVIVTSEQFSHIVDIPAEEAEKNVVKDVEHFEQEPRQDNDETSEGALRQDHQIVEIPVEATENISPLAEGNPLMLHKDETGGEKESEPTQVQTNATSADAMFENEENDVEVIDRATSVDMSVASR